MRGLGIFLPLSPSVINKKMTKVTFQIFRTDVIKTNNQMEVFAINCQSPKENNSSKQRSWQFPRAVKHKAIRICDVCQLLTLTRPFSSTATSHPARAGPQAQQMGRHRAQGGALLVPAVTQSQGTTETPCQKSLLSTTPSPGNPEEDLLFQQLGMSPADLSELPLNYLESYRASHQRIPEWFGVEGT